MNKKRKNQIIVEHENGYYGVLYGKSSMSIFHDGREVLHTGFRNKNIQTKEDLYEHLEKMPEFEKMLLKISKKVQNDTEE